MGNSNTIFIYDEIVSIKTSDRKKFTFSYRNLAHHVVLLRKVIAHPELTQEGEVLNRLIEDYCTRMANLTITGSDNLGTIPWQIEWIWHVHRLHPIAYNDDCTRQLPLGRLVDPIYFGRRVRKDDGKFDMIDSSAKLRNDLMFVPSIDLANAVLRQRDFLEKFKKHFLFSIDFKNLRSTWCANTSCRWFPKMIQNYISFLKLANQMELIVPTFEIDLIWHTHMTSPSYYQLVTTTLCGFVLDHDDSINKTILNNAYEKTASQWKATYDEDYGKNINRDKLKASQYASSCAMVACPMLSRYSSDQNNNSNGASGYGGGDGGGYNRGDAGGYDGGDGSGYDRGDEGDYDGGDYNGDDYDGGGGCSGDES